MSTTHRHDLERIGLRIAAAQERTLVTKAPPDADVILAGVGMRRHRAARRRAIAIAAASALMMILGVLGVLRMMPRADVAKTAPPVTEPALGTTHAKDANVPLHFTDGTRVLVTRGATADLREVREHGATIALHEGTLDVNVVHTESSRWDIVAGAFDVRVTGTRFDASFDPKTAKLTVAMKEGTVRVTGPCVDEPLAAPSTKVFSCERAAAPEIPTISPEALPTAEVKTAKVASSAPSHGASSAISTQARPSAPDDDTTIEKGAAPAVLALGDDARLAGDGARARKIYTRVLERFPKTEHAAKAAFLLGRMAESSGAIDEAVRQYATVTSESPGGAFGQDALGRTMEIEQRRGNTERARALAEQYLRSFPKGPHAGYATSVVDAHR